MIPIVSPDLCLCSFTFDTTFRRRVPECLIIQEWCISIIGVIAAFLVTSLGLQTLGPTRPKNKGLLCHTHTIHGTGIFTYIWLIFMVNVGKYTIHGSYGLCHRVVLSPLRRKKKQPTSLFADPCSFR